MAERTEKNLLIVPGHGVCRKGYTGPLSEAEQTDSWVGIFEGEGPFYMADIREGAERAANDSSTLLVFPGDQPREAAGRRSEAKGCLEIARDASRWSFPGVGPRAATEEYARDSFADLLFGIALFWRGVGTRPVRITVVGRCFKERRYDLHRQALKCPKGRFGCVGVNDPAGEALQAGDGERKRESVSRDLSLTGPEWASQRELRNPFQQHRSYRDVDSDLHRSFDSLDRYAFTRSFPCLCRTRSRPRPRDAMA